MLTRAATRSLRVYGSPISRSTGLSYPQLRSYAKNKPKPYHKPVQPSQTPYHPNGPIPRAAQSSAPVSSPTSDASRLPPDIETSTPSSSNQTPQSTSPSFPDSTEAQSQAAEQEPSSPLPDLTQGIPSTLDSELKSPRQADPQSLNITEDPREGGGREGRDLPNSDYIAASERRRNTIANYVFLAFLGLGASGTIYWGRNWSSEEEEKKHPHAPSGWGLALFYGRARARLTDTLDSFNEPTFQKLLPDPDPQWARPYTLVLSLQDLLVHGEWTREQGWRMAKRPGVDYFLRYLSNYYELVIFTDQPSMIAHPIIQKLDPYRIVMWPLFREATKYKKGQYIKDLAYINRPLDKVIMLDTVAAHASAQPENAVIIPKWKGDLQDKGLVSMIPFLEYCATLEIDDTRKAIKSFEGTYIPVEFAKREAKAREELQAKLAKEKRPSRSMGGLSNMLGMKPQSPFEGFETLSEGMSKGKTYQDVIRERGQKQYEMLEKEIRENGEKWLKDMAEEEKKMNDEAMKGMKSNITSFLPFGSGNQKPSS